ncbi:hypothetical protein ACVXZ4_04140 [Lacisediminihabitans sp. FW035]
MDFTALLPAKDTGSFDWSTSLIILVPTLIIAFLSVPIVTAGITALFRFLSPYARLAAKLKSDLEIFNDLPESPQKAIFARNIENTLAALNNRVTHGSPEPPADQRKSRDRRKRGTKWLLIVGIVGLVIAGAASVVVVFVLFPKWGLNFGQVDPTTTLASVAAVLGALVTAISAAVRSLLTRRMKEESDRVINSFVSGKMKDDDGGGDIDGDEATR